MAAQSFTLELLHRSPQRHRAQFLHEEGQQGGTYHMLLLIHSHAAVRFSIRTLAGPGGSLAIEAASLLSERRVLHEAFVWAQWEMAGKRLWLIGVRKAADSTPLFELKSFAFSSKGWHKTEIVTPLPLEVPRGCRVDCRLNAPQPYIIQFALQSHYPEVENANTLCTTAWNCEVVSTSTKASAICFQHPRQLFAAPPLRSIPNLTIVVQIQSNLAAGDGIQDRSLCQLHRLQHRAQQVGAVQGPAAAAHAGPSGGSPAQLWRRGCVWSASQNRIRDAAAGDHIMVYYPGVMFMLIDCGHLHEPTHHLLSLGVHCSCLSSLAEQCRNWGAAAAAPVGRGCGAGVSAGAFRRGPQAHASAALRHASLPPEQRP